MLDKYMFAVLDCEYILRRNKDVLIDEIKEPYIKIFEHITKLQKEIDGLDEEQYEDEINKLKGKLVKETEKIDFSKMQLLDPSKLFGMFLASIMKLKREYPHKYSICAFDKTPYYHIKAIENYKGDRYNSTEVAKELEEQLKDKTLPILDRKILEYEKAKADWDTKNFWKYQEVKRSLIEKEHDDWAKAGIHTLHCRGFEADQLAVYLADMISKQYHRDNKTNLILLSVDKDWTNFVRPGVDFISIWAGNLKDRQYGNLKEEWEQFHKYYIAYAKNQKLVEDWYDIDRYDYGILTELFVHSHNNATLFEEQEDGFRDELIEKYINKLIDMGRSNRRILRKPAQLMANAELFFRIKNNCKHKNFSSYSTMKNAYTAMNIFIGKTVDIGNDSDGNPYCENIGELYSSILNPICKSVLRDCSTWVRRSMTDLCEKHEISINLMNYSTYVSDLKEKK